MDIANSKKRFVYLLKMNFLGKDYYKIGVFTGYVASRVNQILNDIDHLVSIEVVRTWNIEGKVDHFGYAVQKNYQTELNAHRYLKNKSMFWWFPPFNKMSGKTEWFTDISEEKAIATVLSAIRWADKKPQQLGKDMVITKEGRITKYSDGVVPPYKWLKKYDLL